MKRPERELLGQEKRRLRGAKPSAALARTRLGQFGVWGRILAVFGPISLTAIVLASFLTPMLAVEKIHFVGNERIPSDELESALESLYKRPMTTINDDEVALLLGDFPLIETFATQAEPPHTFRVSIRERQPILILVRQGKNFLYDAAGVQIAATDEIANYPFVVFAGNPIENPKYATAVDLLLSLPLETYSQVFSVEVSEAMTVKLVLRESNLNVLWGSTDEGLLKSEVLASLLGTGLENALTIDVSSPNAPVVQYPNS
ncbi:MAG: FtsQ-type POTRA domain-containing protein [Aquiluna sp.]|nr:FtsQ-type POTRA domain-containing protein [Aquiluna sp.]